MYFMKFVLHRGPSAEECEFGIDICYY